MNTSKPSRILVLRFSALGDVAMTIPVLWSFRRQFPGVEICVVSRPFAAPLLSPLPGVKFFPLELQKRHRGFAGIFRLFRDLKQLEGWTAVADLHDVLRTRMLRFLFKLSGVRTASIDKGRREKKLLTRKANKRLDPLKSTHERYADVFRRLGYSVSLKADKIFPFFPESSADTLSRVKSKTGPWVGIAPFAKHKGKSYPLDKMKLVVHQLLEDPELHIFLFGGGPQEEEALAWFSKDQERVDNLSGKFPLEEELAFMSQLDVMISMDSANMHLASLAGVPVISIWGATHPYAGFYGWNQSQENAIQTDLFCRPCSVFGNKPCWRKDYACLEEIEPGDISGRVRALLSEKRHE
jgi:ADP-heptose:LPS heptosyltransferase